MAKGGKFGKIIGKVVDGTIENAEDKIKETKDEYIEKLKTDPFSIVDATAVVGFCEDPIGVLVDTVTDPEFIGAAIAVALECVPGVGPILSSVFSMFWPTDSDPAKQVVTAEELEKKLAEFKTEMEAIMDKKIAESEVNQWKKICDAFFNGLTANMEILKDKISVLKLRLKEGKAESSLKTYVREALETMRVQVKTIISFCAANSTLEDTTDYYMDCLFIYIVIMRHLDSFWFQLDIDEYFVTGYPAKDGEEAIKSFRERVNLVLTKGINDISIGASRTLAKAIRKLDIKLLEKNTKLDKDGSKLLKLNQLLYPIKLIEHPEKIRRLYKTFEEREFGYEPITLPDTKTAYIYRVDGAMFYPAQKSDYINGYRIIPYGIEPISGCTGAFNSSGPLSFALPKARVVQVRIFGVYYYGLTTMKVNGRVLGKRELRPLNSVDTNITRPGVTSGFYTSEKLITRYINLEFHELQHPQDADITEKILFVEVIVHDDSETPADADKPFEDASYEDYYEDEYFDLEFQSTKVIDAESTRLT